MNIKEQQMNFHIDFILIFNMTETTFTLSFKLFDLKPDMFFPFLLLVWVTPELLP